MLTRCAVAKHHEDIVIKYRRAHFEASEIGKCNHVRLPGLEPGSTRLQLSNRDRLTLKPPKLAKKPISEKTVMNYRELDERIDMIKVIIYMNQGIYHLTFIKCHSLVVLQMTVCLKSLILYVTSSFITLTFCYNVCNISS